MALSIVRPSTAAPGGPGSPPPELITYAEAARRLGGVSTRHIERLVAAGRLRRVGRGRARRITVASLLRYIAEEAGNE